MTDDELLAICKAEKTRSIGFDHDSELRSERERALNYRKGVMNDVPHLPNRSSAVSTDVADAVETILPDLMEIFTGGDDVASFQATPKTPEEADEAEKRAQQETDYVNHVVFEENDGFMVLYAMFKDALEVKTGVVKWWGEEYEADHEEYTGKSAVELQLALDEGELVELEEVPATEGGAEPTYNFKIKGKPRFKVCIKAVSPEDFTVAPDTVRLKDAPYCAHRSRPRAQDLLSRGIDADKVNMLGAYDVEDDTVRLARDTAGEHENPQTNEAVRSLRQVEVVEHYIRLKDGKEEKIWRVLTGQNEAILLEKEEVEEIQFSAITPFVVTHRFYGESIADKLMEVQKIKTVLTRMMLDSGYFALNQRMSVDMNLANEFTISDLLRNEPAMPIRTNGPGAVVPISAGALNFDVMGGLEYMSTVGEQRSGVVRNAQGLNPDTLHDTAKGALALMTAAQRRVRMIARIFAEMGLKDLFLGVHALLRRHSTAPAIVKLRGNWVPVDPTQWSERSDMTIEIGLGASGAEAEMASFAQLLPVIENVVTLQGGMDGPIFTKENIYALVRRLMEKGAKLKGVERFISDPANAPPAGPPPPDPEMVKAQAEMQAKQAELQMKQAEGQANLQLKAQEGQMNAQLAEQQAIRDHDLAVRKIEGELQLKRETTMAELQMKRELLAAELEMKREVALLNAEISRETGMAKVQASGSVSEVSPGGEPG